MHIFLTGAIQIGKSTVIDKIVSRLQVNPGGFKTYFGPDRYSSDRLLYMNPAAEPRVFQPDLAVVVFTTGCPPQALTERWDKRGVQLIRTARTNSNLIVMDECGSLEAQALLFQKEVLDTLEGNIPVLGVVKMDSRGWTDRIRNHPRVKLITITKENRDALPLMLADEICLRGCSGRKE